MKKSEFHKNNRKPNYNNNNLRKRMPVSDKAIAIFFMFIVTYPVYLRGLFFDIEQFITLTFTFILFGVFIMCNMKSRQHLQLKTPVEYSFLGLIIVYAMSIFAAVNTRSAVITFLIYVMYLMVFLVASNLFSTLRRKMILLWVVTISAVGVCILGIDSGAGSHLVNLANGIFEYIGISKVFGTEKLFFSLIQGNRIYSTLQYPNTLAAFLMCVFFLTVVIALLSKRLWKRIIALMAGFIIITTFILTISRGAYLLFPIVFIVFSILLPKKSKVKGILLALSSLIPAIACGFLASRYISDVQNNSLKIWSIIFAGLIISGLMGIVSDYISSRLERVSLKVYLAAGMFILVASVCIGGYLLYSTAPLELSHAKGKSDSYIQKIVQLEPLAQYTLQYKVEASNELDKPSAYYVKIINKTDKDILLGEGTSLGMKEERNADGSDIKEIHFEVPQESKAIQILFGNVYEGTRATFYDAKIVEKETGKNIKNIVLKYRYIPDSIAQRLNTIKTDLSTLQRIIYIEDGLKMFKDHWLLGAGGGAWASLYTKYQSFKYDSTQAHSFLLQVAIESGIVGLLIIVLLIASIIFQSISVYKKQSKERDDENILYTGIAVAALALLLHSLGDFTLSYPAIGLILFVLLGILNQNFKAIDNIYVKENKNKLEENITNLKSINVNNYLILIFTAAFAVFSLMLYISTVYNRGAREAALNGNSQTAVDYYKKASNTDPLMPIYKINYAKLLLQKKEISQQDIKEASNYISRAERLSRYDTDSSTYIGEYYLYVGEIDKGLSSFNRAAELQPLNPQTWENAINAHYQVGKYATDKDDIDKARSYANKAMLLIDQIKRVNERNLNPFVLSPKAMEELEICKYINENAGKAGSVDKVVFYNYPQIDVDNDGHPDQWSINDPTVTKIYFDKDLMCVDNTKTGYGNIVSRKLSLEAGKKYRIELELDDAGEIGEIHYNLTGVSSQTGALILSGSAYMTEISTPLGFKADNNVLWLGMPGKVNIKSIKIYEI